MLLRVYTTILTLLVVIISYSQETSVIIPTDTAKTVDGSYVYPDTLSPGLITRLLNPGIGNMMSYEHLYGQPLTVTSNLYDRKTVMPQIGGLGGYVTSSSLPGLMGIESGVLSYSLSADGFSFTPSVYVNKYGYYGGLTTSLGVGGKMSVRISGNLSLTAFGEYHTNSWTLYPAVMSNMQSSRFGGYGTLEINGRWSLSAGAQRVYNSATNHWQTVPVLIPTYKINGKAAIGFDV